MPRRGPPRRPGAGLSAPRIVVCGAGVVGVSVAYHLAVRGAPPLVVDRVGPAAAASGSASGFVALDWNAGTPLDAMSRASFALHAGLADELGAERIARRPTDVILAAAADEGDMERYRGLPNPPWLDGNAVAHQVIGSTETTAQLDPRRFTEALLDAAVARGARFEVGTIEGLALDGPGGAVTAVTVDGERCPADVVVLALGPWTPLAQRWLPLPQVLATRWASVVLGADLPAEVVFSDFASRDGRRVEFRIYPRPGGVVYVTGMPEHVSVPDHPADVVPHEESIAELRRIAGVHAGALRDAAEVTRSACHRPVTIDGLPLIGPVPGAPGVHLATGHASWGVLNAPATGRMVAEMILDGRSHSLDASPFAVTRLPAGRI